MIERSTSLILREISPDTKSELLIVSEYYQLRKARVQTVKVIKTIIHLIYFVASHVKNLTKLTICPCELSVCQILDVLMSILQLAWIFTRRCPPCRTRWSWWRYRTWRCRRHPPDPRGACRSPCQRASHPKRSKRGATRCQKPIKISTCVKVYHS